MPSAARVARTSDEAAAWSGATLVIDVIRFSTTVCALARAGRRTIRIHGSADSLKRDLAGFSEADVFSERDLGPDLPAIGARAGGVRRFDNSPFAALNPAGAARPALVFTVSGSRAAAACGRAARIYVGGFCNFAAATAALKREPLPLLLVPAALWLDTPRGQGQWIEDTACAAAFAEALAGRGGPQEHLARVQASERPEQFRRFRPRDAGRDLGLCLGLDTLPVVPRITLTDGVGTVQIK